MAQLILLSVLIVVAVGSILLLINRKSPQEHTQPEIDLTKVFESNKLIGYADVSKVQIGLDDRNRMRRFKEKVFPVVISRSDKQLIIKTHESITLKDIRKVSKSLGQDLFDLSIFPTSNIAISSADRLDTYVIRCLTNEEVVLQQLVRKSGLVEKTDSGEEVWPEIETNDRGVIRLTSSMLNLAQVERALPNFNQLGKSYELATQEGDTFTISPVGAFEQFLKNNDTVYSRIEDYLNRFVRPHQDKSPQWMLGINQITGEEVWRPLMNYPALLILGATGGGKTATTKSILFNLVATHPETILYIYDGKDNGDWADFADSLSPYPVAGRVYGSNALQGFYLIDKVFKEYLNRAQLFKEVRANNFEVYKKKTGKKLPHIILILEEFPAMVDELDFEKNHSVINSPAYKLKRLIQESRSYGFGYVFLSQNPKVEVVPSILSNNMIKVVHRSETQVANSLQLPGVLTLKRGYFYTKSDEGTQLCSNLFLGDEEIEKLLKAAGVTQKPEKTDIDPNFAQPTGSEKERSEFAPLLRSALIKQGFEVKNWDNSNHSSSTGVVKMSDMSVKIAFIKKDELSAIHIKSVNDASVTHLLTLCEFAVDEKKELELVKRAQEFEFGDNKVIFVTDSLWKRLIYQAFESESKNTICEFIRSRSELLTLTENTSAQSTEDADESVSSEVVADSDITIKRLNVIRSLKGKGETSKRKKGKAFEAFIAGLYLKKGYEVIFDIQLKRQKYTFNQRGDADGGLDLVARRDNELILIQAKNWTWDVDNSAVQQILAASATLKGTRNEEATKLVVISASDFTQPARSQAEAAGVELWGYARLLQEVRLFEVEKRGKGRPKKVA
ncbi:restriction endonuclease [Bdellovibrio bacteriovorus]|uniref:restriction endonuclease n=1 Tax=Bdellovibrio bacteriovorus TaxID=959 RepID=UPI003AA9E06A